SEESLAPPALAPSLVAHTRAGSLAGNRRRAAERSPSHGARAAGQCRPVGLPVKRRRSSSRPAEPAGLVASHGSARRGSLRKISQTMRCSVDDGKMAELTLPDAEGGRGPGTERKRSRFLAR